MDKRKGYNFTIFLHKSPYLQTLFDLKSEIMIQTQLKTNFILYFFSEVKGLLFEVE